MRAKLLLLLPLLALAELKDVVVSGKMNLLHYVAKELASPQKAETHKVMGNGLLKACKMDPMVFYTDILFYVFKCHSDVKSVSVHLPGNNNYLDGYQVENFDVAMEHTDSPKLKHVVSCPVGITNPTDSSCSTYMLDFYRAAPDIATLESMAMSSKSVIVVEPAFNSGTSSYSTTVEIENPFSISARTLQPKGRAGIQAPEGAGLTAELNGCDKAEQSQAVWEFPGFKSTGVFTFASRLSQLAEEQNSAEQHRRCRAREILAPGFEPCEMALQEVVP